MRNLGVSSSWLVRHRIALALTLVVLFGAGLRVWYALPDPHQSRFWDERYSFENVEKILETWSFEPARGYYPAPIQSWPQALVIAASQEIAERAGIGWLDPVNDNGRFTRTAFVLVRLLSVVYGTLALLLLFLVGRRLFSPAVGLFAALALAATPWHINVSAKFKPDALLVLTVLLAFYWSLGAIERGRWRDYFLAGLGVALAASAKLLGVLIAAPIAVGGLWLAVRDRSRLWRLVFAGAASAVTFFLLNPYGERYLWYVQSLQRDYAKRAEWSGMLRSTMPAELGEFLLGRAVHGPLIGSLAVAGLLGLLAVALRSRRTPLERRVEAGMLVVFPLVYSVSYLAATPYFKGNNLVPIVPFTTLAAIWLMLTGWRWLAKERPGVRWLGGLGAVGLAVLLASPGTLYIYRSFTPTTLDLAYRSMRRGVGASGGRVLFVESVEMAEPLWNGHEPFDPNSATIVVERLDGVDETRLARADGEIFPARRLRGDDAAFYRLRMKRLPEQRVRTIAPRLFRARGPRLIAIRHWRRAGSPWIEISMEDCGDGARLCLRGTVPGEIRPGELVSASIRILPGVVGDHPPPEVLRIGAVEVPLRMVRGGVRRLLFVTERIPLPAAGSELCLESDHPRADGGRIRVALRQWGPESDPVASSSAEPDDG